MAQSSEILDLDKTTKAIISMDTALSGASKTFLTFVKNSDTVTTSLKANTVTLETLTKAQKEAANAQKLLDAANKQLTDSEAKLKTFDAQMYEQILKNNKALADQKKAIQDKVKASDAEEGSLVKMRLKLAELEKEYVKMSATMREKAAPAINALSREIGQAEEATNRGQRNVGQYGSVWDKVSGVFLGVMAAVAAAAGAIKFAHSVIESSEELSDKFKVTTEGLNSAWGYFLNTLATGDWSNFIKNITEANRLGREYAEALELLEKRQRGNSLAVIEAKEEAARLKMTLTEGNKTYAEKTAIMQKVIDLEMKTGVVTRDLAAESKTILYEKTAGIKGVDKAELEAFIRFKEGSVAQFKQVQDYNDLIKKRNDLLAQGSGYSAAKVGISENVISGVTMYDKAINSASESTKQWSAIMLKLSPEEIEALTAASKEASETSAEVYTAVLKDSKRLGMFQKGMRAEDKAASDEAAKERMDKLEALGITEISDVKKRHLDGITNEEQYQAELLAIDIVNLDKKLKLYSKGDKDYETIQLQIQDKLIKLDDDKAKRFADMNSQVDKILVDHENKKADRIKQSIDDEEAMYDEELKLTEKAAEKKIEDEKKTAEKIKDIQFQMASEAVNGIFDLGSAKRDEELSALDKEKSDKLKNKNLTESQKVKIEEEYAKKSAAIKTKQAKANKLQAMFNIALNTFEGSMKAVAESPLTGGMPFLAWVIAAGALQLALTAAQPIPKFAKGTKNAPDKGIFGEAGRELAFLKSGEVLLANQATYFDGSKFKGANIKSNPETENILRISEHTAGGRQMTDDRILKGLSNVERAILSKPVAIFDRENRVIGQATTNSQTIYLNRLMRNN